MDKEKEGRPQGRSSLFSARCYFSLNCSWISRSTSTGFPFTIAGGYTHCLTASLASSTSWGLPLIAFTLNTFPRLSTLARSTTVPSIPSCCAPFGYLGETIFSGEVGNASSNVGGSSTVLTGAVGTEGEELSSWFNSCPFVVGSS